MQPKRAEASMVCKVSGKSTEVKLEHPDKALEGRVIIDVFLLISTKRNERQLRRMKDPRNVTEVGNDNDVNLLHFSKAPFPMLTTPCGICISTRLTHPQNVPFPIIRSDGGN